MGTRADCKSITKLTNGGFMYTYVVYEISNVRPFAKRVDTVKANTSESARRKAIIGTKIKYNNVRAYAYL